MKIKGRVSMVRVLALTLLSLGFLLGLCYVGFFHTTILLERRFEGDGAPLRQNMFPYRHRVSIYSLLAAPEEFEERRVRVTGYFGIYDREYVIAAGRDFYGFDESINSIAISRNSVDIPIWVALRWHGHLVTVEGEFTHWRGPPMSAGRIWNISSITLDR
jgi:hypothetical protein